MLGNRLEYVWLEEEVGEEVVDEEEHEETLLLPEDWPTELVPELLYWDGYDKLETPTSSTRNN